MRLRTGAQALLLSAVIVSCSGSCFAAAPGAAGLPPQAASSGSLEYPIKKVKPSLVRIFVVSSDISQGREIKYEVSGSGTIITREGHVVTNHHVIRNAKLITCTLSDNEEIDADLLATDPLTDLAVIRLRGKPGREFPTASFGDSSRLRVGDRVLAMGSPYALSQSVTMGIVSNTEMIMPRFFGRAGRFTVDGEDVGAIVRWIGHDAQIFGGNSGGPLVNLDGEIIGINEIKFGISGAIPGNLAGDVAEKLIKFGRVPRSWIGLEIQPLPKVMAQQSGALVGGTIEGSPAAAAGFLPGDILLSLNGNRVDVHFDEEAPLFNLMTMGLPVNTDVVAEVLRGGVGLTLTVRPQDHEYVQTANFEISHLGITAQNISYMTAKEMGRENREGVLITSIRPGGPCAEAKPRLLAGDIATSINGSKIRNIDDLMRRPEGASALVAFERKKEKFITVVKPDNGKTRRDQGAEIRKAWLPVALQAVTRDIAEALGIGPVTGLRITQVYETENSLKSGLMVGDIITALDGEALRISSSEDVEVLSAMIRQYKIGAVAELTIIRDGKKTAVTVTLEKSPVPTAEMTKYTDKTFDFTVREISFFDGAREGLGRDGSGVIVESVVEGGWAALARLSVGDIITSIDGVKVSGVSDFERVIKEAASKKPKQVLMKVRRGIHGLFIEMDPTWRE